MLSSGSGASNSHVELIREAIGDDEGLEFDDGYGGGQATSGSRPELSIEQVFELLLEAREGKFDPDLPTRSTASPINRDVDLFYVVPSSTRRMQAGPGELRVKYNNVIRSKIWWSARHGNKLGVVSRAMSMKTRSESHESHRSFEHGFQGHWVSLLKRPDDGPIQEKAVIRTFVQENSPSLVQFWPAPTKKRASKSPASRMTKLPEGHEDPGAEDSVASGLVVAPAWGVGHGISPTSASSTPPTASAPHPLMVPLGDESGVGSTESGMDSGATAEPTFLLSGRMSVDMVEGMLDSITLFDSSHRASAEALYEAGLNVQRGSVAMASGSAVQQLKRVLSGRPGEMASARHSSPDLASLQETAFDDGEDKCSGDARFRPVRRLSGYVGGGDVLPDNLGALQGQSPKTKPVSNSDLELALDCILSVGDADDDRDAMLAGDFEESSGEESGDSGGDDEADHQAAKRERRVKGSVRSKASVVAFELFKNACDIMESDEFSVWYERHVSKLFEPTTSRQIKYCLDKNDPRLSPDFLFPEGVSFLPDSPVAYGLFRGTYSTGWELLKGSEELNELVGYEAAGSIYLYETILESKVLDLFSHLVYKKKVAEGSIKPLDYYFQTIAKLPSGKRMIVRVHCWWFANSQETHNTNESGNAMHVRMQDVSSLFPNILHLPALPY